MGTRAHEAESLGMLLAAREEVLQIKEIFAEGLLPDWHRAVAGCSPDRQVEPGDVIVEVNGLRDKCRAMVDVCKQSMTVHLVIRRMGKLREHISSMDFENLNQQDMDVLANYDASRPCKNGVLCSDIVRLPRIAAAMAGDMCAICLANDCNAQLTRLPCQHSFCTKCIFVWLTEHKPHCPTCKRSAVLHSVERVEHCFEDHCSDEFADADCSGQRSRMMLARDIFASGGNGVGRRVNSVAS